MSSQVFTLSFLVAFLCGLAFSDWMANLPVFRAATLQLDGQLQRDVMNSQAIDAKHAVLVTIDAKDHQLYFGGGAPLDPDKLMQTVERLLQERPAVLVVDIDTQHPRFANVELPASEIPVVWARVLAEKLDGSGEYESRPILGGLPSDSELPCGHSSGLAAIRTELDWSVRTFDRSFTIHGVGPRRTLFEQAACEYRGTCQEPIGSHSQSIRLFRHYYDFVRRPVSQFLDSPATDGELSGKIVVLGLTEDPGDVHRTVTGPEPGCALVASAIEHDLRGAPGEQIEAVGRFGIELLLSLTIVFINSRLRPQAALLTGLVMLGGLVYFGAWLAFWILGYQASVVPFVLGILLEQLSSTAQKAQDSDRDQDRAAATSA